MADMDAIKLVQEDKPLQFNNLVEARQGQVDLSDAMFRGYDLRKFNLKQANLTNCYMRSADLRGLDLSQAQMFGVSMRAANVSGTLFPANISAQEIMMSLEHGTRLREVH